jgi:hypothetical protein
MLFSSSMYKETFGYFNEIANRDTEFRHVLYVCTICFSMHKINSYEVVSIHLSADFISCFR